MANQTMSVRRIVITNFLILAVIGIVCMLSFHNGLSYGLSKAVNSPLFAGHAASGSVGLEIAFCGDAGLEECTEVLKGGDVKASLFFCPDWVKKDPDIIAKAAGTGYHAGLYACSKHAIDFPIPDGTVVLGDFSVMSVAAEAPVNAKPVCWTFDANKALSSPDALKGFSSDIYENSIVLYRYTGDAAELKKLLKILRETGYNITDVKSMM